MAEGSDGPQTDHWKCVNPGCKLELPNYMPTMRFCPSCGTQQTQKVQHCMQCSAPLMSPIDAMNHRCEAARTPTCTSPVSQQGNNDVHERDKVTETSPPTTKSSADDSASQSVFSSANPIVAASTTSQTGSSSPSLTFQTSESVANGKSQGPTSSPLPEKLQKSTVGQDGSSNSRTALVTGRDGGVNMGSHGDNSLSTDALSNLDHSRVLDSSQEGKTTSGGGKEEDQEKDAKQVQSMEKEVGVNQKKDELKHKESGTTSVDPDLTRSGCSGSSKSGASVTTTFQVLCVA